LLDLSWFLIFTTLSCAWCLQAGLRLSATFDEPVYLQRGLEAWRTHSYRELMKLGTMPLPVDVVTGPLHLWERCTGAPFDVAADFERLLPLARASTLAFWLLLLWYARRAGRMLAGPWAGRVAVAFLACEPSFLAHASLATTDIAISACLLAFVVHFREGRDNPRWLCRVGLPAFWFAAAILAKASGLVFAPLCAIAVELERRWDTAIPGLWLRWRHAIGSLFARRNLADYAQVAVGGLALTFLYVGCEWEAKPSIVAAARAMPAGPRRETVVWLAENLRIFPNAGEGIVRQVTHNIRGHGSFLLGHWHPRAFWYYFPVLMTIKFTLPIVLAPLVFLLAAPARLRNAALWAAFGLAVFSVLCRVQIGIRFMLPLAVLAIVGLAAALVGLTHDASPRRRPVVVGLAGLALLWNAANACLVFPQALCFVNEAWGGTWEGHRRVSEANFDWGQGLPELTAWHERAGRPILDVWYFGTDPSVRRLPPRLLELHYQPLQTPEEVERFLRGRLLAVSYTFFSFRSSHPAHQAAIEFLRHHVPIDRTTTFAIYDFRPECRADIPPTR
jgi:hypothetical protein